MQNIIQMLMQQWGRGAKRQVFNRETLLLSTSVMLAMQLVGCSIEEALEDTVGAVFGLDSDIDTKVAIQKLIDDKTTDQNVLQDALEDNSGSFFKPSVDENASYAAHINSEADFVEHVEANDSGTFYFQYEDATKEPMFAILQWNKVTVNFEKTEGIYYFRFDADVFGLSLAGGSSVIDIGNSNQFRVYEVAYDPEQVLFKAQGSHYIVCSDGYDEKPFLMTGDQCPVSLDDVGRNEVNFLEALTIASNHGYVFDWPEEYFMAESFNDAQSKQVGDVTIYSPDSPPSCDYMYNIESLNEMTFDNHEIGETIHAVRAYGDDGVAVVKGVEEDVVIKYQDIGLQSQEGEWSCIDEIA